MKFLNLDNIVLPDIDELQCVLTPWLRSKSHCYEQATQNGDGIKTECQKVSTVDASTQCDTVQRFDKCFVPSAGEYTPTIKTVTKSKETQCHWIRNEEDCATQTEFETVDKAIQHVHNCDEKDSTCSFNNLKQEPVVLSALKCSSVNSLNVTVKNSSRDVLICKHCKQIFHTKGSYQMHRKSHMVCQFCKKKFISVKQTKWHVENDCEIRKIMDTQLAVKLVRFEETKEALNTYPKCLEDLSNLKKEKVKIRPTLRMRSKSTQSADAPYSCCSTCGSFVSMLQDLKLGIDKSVQTDLLTLLDESVVLQVNCKNSKNSIVPPKKRKFGYLFNTC